MLETNQAPSVRTLNEANNASGGMNTSFTADSPYFNSYVDKEIDNLGVLKSTLQDISKNARAFGQCGAAMVEATRNLSSSCKLQSKLHDISEDDMDLEMRMERARLYGLKKECMGDEMLKVLSLLGEVLDEIADAQLQMCMSLQASLCEPLDTFAEDDIPNAYRYRNEANATTDTSARHFGRYMHGSDPTAQAPVQGNPLTPPSNTGGGGTWRDFRNMKSAINQRLAGGIGVENNAVNRQNSGNSDVSGDANLRQISCGLANAELSRFQLLRYLDSLKTRRDYELGESTLASLHGIRAYFHHCSDLTQGLAPRFNALQEDQSKIREKLEQQQRPWEAQQRCLNIIIREFEKSRANVDAYDPNQTVSEMEEDVGIWTLPRQLANASVYQRQPDAGIVIEGWLYKKSSARISINTWSRRWFIVDETSIYYLKREGMMGGAFSNSSPERVKVCDIVLCTVRDVHTKGGHGNRFCFEIMSANNRPFLLQACGPNDQELWVKSIRKCIEKNLGKTYNDGPSTQRTSSSSSSTPQWSPYGDATSNRVASLAEDHSNVKNPVTRAVLENNKFCADCGEDYPDWVSLNLCVLICIECSGIHRSLGVHVSKVRSMKMDELSPTEAKMLLLSGNDTCNSIYEAGVKDQSGWKKPKPRATRREREEWIKSKYVWKGFLIYEKMLGGRGNNQGEQFWNFQLYDAAKRGNIIDLIDALVHGGAVDWKNKDEGGKTALHVCAIGGPPMESNIEGDVSDDDDDLSNWSGLECAEYLIQNGAKLDAQDDDHQHVLDCAVCRGGRIDMVEYLHSRMS